MPFIGRDAFLKSKQATGRSKDLADVARFRRPAPADQMSLGSTCSVKSVKLRWLSGAHMR